MADSVTLDTRHAALGAAGTKRVGAALLSSKPLLNGSCGDWKASITILFKETGVTAPHVQRVYFFPLRRWNWEFGRVAWRIKIKTEKLLLLANMESQGPITTLSPNPRTPRPDPGGNSFQHSEAHWSQEMGPHCPSSLPQVFRWWCREGSRRGPADT